MGVYILITRLATGFIALIEMIFYTKIGYKYLFKMGGNIIAKKKKGTEFEGIAKKDLIKVGYLVGRLHDAPPPYGVKKPADFYAYKYPHFIYVECKETIKTLWNIKAGLRDSQLEKMLDAVNFYGVKAFILIWFKKHKFIYCIEITNLKELIDKGYKSVNIKNLTNDDFRGKIIHEIENKTFDLSNFEMEV